MPSNGWAETDDPPYSVWGIVEPWAIMWGAFAE